MPTPSCRDALSREVSDPVTDPLTGLCFRNPCAAEEAGVLNWVPGCVVASPVYAGSYEVGSSPWVTEVYWNRVGSGGRRRRGGFPGGGAAGGSGRSGGGRFGPSVPAPQLPMPQPQKKPGGQSAGRRQGSSFARRGPQPSSSSATAADYTTSYQKRPTALTPASAEYTASYQKTPTSLPGSTGARYTAAPATARTTSLPGSTGARYTAAPATARIPAKGPNGLGQLAEDQSFVVHCDNWAQIPGLNGRMRRYRGLRQAIEAAKKNAAWSGDGTCRIYRPTNGWLLRQNALVTVQRTGAGFSVRTSSGLRGLGQADAGAINSAVSQIVAGSARVIALVAVTAAIPPLLVGFMVRRKTKSWGKAALAAGGTAALEGAILGGLSSRSA